MTTLNIRAALERLVELNDIFGGFDWKPWPAAIARARAALAAEPEPPAEEEVAELVAWLRETGQQGLDSGLLFAKQNGRRLTRAADLLERLASPACVVLKPSPELIEAFKAAVPGQIEAMERLAPQPVPEGPSDKELLELMPQQFRDDLATVSQLATVSRLALYGKPVEPEIYWVSLSMGALDYVRAVLARWGRL